MNENAPNDLTDEQLAAAWIERYEIVSRDGDQTRAAKQLFWAFQALDALCSSDPTRAWRVIATIMKTTTSEPVLDNLIAGPLESLLARNGRVVIEVVENEAGRNPQFRELLQGLWRNVIPIEIWQRVERARGSSR